MMIDNAFRFFRKPPIKKASFVAVILIACVAVGVLFRILFVMGMNAYSVNEAKNDKYSVSHYTSMIQLYTGDFMEPYIAYYNAGTSAAQNKNYPLAEALLVNSLQRVDNVTNECLVRNNLSLVYVEQGKFYTESEMPVQAVTYYDKAIATITDAPSTCFPPPPREGQSEDGEEPQGGEEQPGESQSTPDRAAGEQMEETKANSEETKEELEGEKPDNSDGKETLEDEFNNSKANSDNSADQKQQEGNPKPSVNRPW